MQSNEHEKKPPTICNQCGGSCMKKSHPDSDPEVYGLEAAVTGGYASDELRDLLRYSFAICEACLVKLFDGFKIPPACAHMALGIEDPEPLRFMEETTWAEDRRAREWQIKKEAETALPDDWPVDPG